MIIQFIPILTELCKVHAIDLPCPTSERPGKVKDPLVYVILHLAIDATAWEPFTK